MEELPRFFDICIVCALHKEANAVVDEFSKRCSTSFSEAYHGLDRYEYRYATIYNKDKEPLTVLVTWLPEIGPVATASVVRSLLQQFHPRFVAMAGICAGDQSKVQLGDLIVASAAYHYEEGMMTSEPEGHQPATHTFGPPDQILQYTQGFTDWEKPAIEMQEQFLKKQDAQAVGLPQRFVAVMASGMAVRADNPFPWLQQKHNRHTIALDMEAASFYTALRSFTHALVVKGVCDYASMEKNDSYQDYAARISAVYLLHFIQKYVTNKVMPPRDISAQEKEAKPSGIWNVPYLRNPHFTGRDELLSQLEQQLSSENHNDPTARRTSLTQPRAIKGLGGIGKTQIAIEYAYRSRDLDRYTHTFWTNAATKEALLTSFIELAALLPPDFSAKDEPDQSKLVEATKRWLEQCQQCWLLIFDNADDISLIRNYLPQRGNGCILLTTRADAVGSLATSIEVETMGFIEGTHLLLRRAQRFEQASDEAINQAGNIVVALDHFPLALDQAGAYIEETGCSFVSYLEIYQESRQVLLAQRGIPATEYPHSVATTWSLSFQKIQQANPAATELLRLCAFLAPDRIPEDLIKEGHVYWPPLLQQAAAQSFTFNQMMAELLKFSLVKRLTEGQSFSMHRLVQAIQMDRIEPESQHQWAESVIRAVNKIFPENPKDVTTWPQCVRYLDQAQVCNTLIEHYTLLLSEGTDLLNRAGFYLDKHASYPLAEPLYRQALVIREQQLQSQLSDTALSLNNLAEHWRVQGKYDEAEPLYYRALTLFEQVDADHPLTAACLNNLALLYNAQEKYEKAEPLFQRALAIWEKQGESMQFSLALCLNNLANLYYAQKEYAKAEPLFQRALAIWKQEKEAINPDMALSMNNLAELYTVQGKYQEAEPLFQQALAIFEQRLGPMHPNTAYSLNNLARLYSLQEKYEEAEPLYRRALTIFEQMLEPTHFDTAGCLSNLALLYYTQGKYKEAKELLRRAIVISEKQVGAEHPYTQNLQQGYTSLLKAMGDAE